jgi:glycosyltransferase involved in cell wall biosynthesis
MKNILFISHSGNGGGAENVLAHTINDTFENSSKYKRFVIYPKFQGLQFKKMLNPNVYSRVVFYRSNSSNTLKSIICNIINVPGLFYLLGFCYLKRINVIYINSSVNFIGTIVGILTRTKVIWHIHEQPNDKVKIIPNYIRNIYKNIFISPKFNLIFVSGFSREKWEKTLSIKIEKASIVYPPVRSTESSFLIKKTNSEFCFGYLGALVNEKNIISLLEAFATIVKLNTTLEVNLKIAGNGLLRTEIKQMCDELGIADRVEILKFNSDVSDFFSKIDALVQPSYSESWGLVALEAMSYGKAVVLTKESGLKEILKDGVDCLFIDPLDTVDIAKKMNFLLDNKLDCSKIAENGFLKFQSFNFNDNFNRAVQSLVDSEI